MAPPPKYIIQRKLVRSVVKKVIPKNPLIPKEYFENILNCWRDYGVGSQKCHEQQLMFDYAQQQTISFKERLQKLGIKQAVTSQLKKPVYPFEIKGRHYQFRARLKSEIQYNNLI